MAYPQHSNWEEKSDLVYAPALRKAPLILDSDQQMEVDQCDGTKAMPPIQGKNEIGNIYQRTTSRRLNRYELLKSNVVSESEHTIKLKHGPVLRKSAVAVGPKQTPPKKRKPVTVTEMLASAKRGVIRSPNSKKPKTANIQPSLIAELSDSSDSKDHQPLHSIPLRLPVEFEARQEAITAVQGTSGTLAQEKRGKGAETDRH